MTKIITATLSRDTMDRTARIAALHQSDHPAVVVVTGGGLSLVRDLLCVPGASKTVLEAHVPYSAAALSDWLGQAPGQACSERTALAMATVAYARAQALCRAERLGESSHENCLGIACTAALVSERPKRGAHRAHLAVQSRTGTLVLELTLEKGARDRVAEDQLVSDVLLQAILEAAGLPALALEGLRADDHLQRSLAKAPPFVREVREQQWPQAYYMPLSEWQAGPLQPVSALFPGSFDPLHFGHLELHAAAERHLGCPVVFELSLANVDKPPLDYITIERRLVQFTQQPVLVTNAPTFQQKSQLFPGSVFVVGIDTAVRIVDPRYYGHDPERMWSALQQLREAGCRFLVAGRLQAGSWNTLANAAALAPVRDLFEELPEVEFRADVSSTELRRQRDSQAEADLSSS